MWRRVPLFSIWDVGLATSQKCCQSELDQVVAVDPDGESLKIARENHSASNIEYIQADDQTFPPGPYI